jgi:hypothetical protein
MRSSQPGSDAALLRLPLMWTRAAVEAVRRCGAGVVRSVMTVPQCPGAVAAGAVLAVAALLVGWCHDCSTPDVDDGARPPR